MTNRRRPVKRSYSSVLREQQHRATKRLIVDAAARLFAERGYAAVSMDAIASAAGVSRATAFTAFGGKPGLLRAAYADAFARVAGGGEGVPLVERPRSAKIHEEKTAKGYIEGYASLATDLAEHLGPINEALREAAASDAELAALFAERYAERRRGCDRIVAEVAKRAKLRADVDKKAAAEIIWILNDPYVYVQLVGRAGWTREAFARWLAESIARALL
jgi:AcrR family transcriptional regulator